MLGSIIVESLVVGIVASLIGLFLGLLLAKGLFWLFDAVGFTLPNTGLVFETRTIVVALLAGILVTLLASLRPGDPRDARAADRRRARGRDAAAGPVRALPLDRRRAHDGRRVRGAPLRALRERASTRRRSSSGWASARCSSSSASRSSRPGSSARSPACSAGRRRGSAAPPASLARDNARRNPQRTASTAAALMIGLALVTLVATLAAGIVTLVQGRGERPLHRRLRDHRAEQLLADPDRRRRGRRAGAGRDRGRERPHGRGRSSSASPTFATAVDPGMAAGDRHGLGRRARRTSSRTLGETGVFVDDGTAEDNDLALGSPVDGDVPERHEPALRRRGHLRPAGRRVAVRRGDDLRRGLGRARSRTRGTSTRS